MILIFFFFYNFNWLYLGLILGGRGGQGVPGISCRVRQEGIIFHCEKTGRPGAPQGATGQKGASGSSTYFVCSQMRRNMGKLEGFC